jgi:O-acetyl-ADP-ribose deacetylase
MLVRWRSPAISTGIFGFPGERAASIAIATLNSLDETTVERVILVAFDDETLRIYLRALGRPM